MRRQILTIALVTLLLVLAPAIYAQRGPRPGSGDMLREFTNARIAARLNLTPDQVKQIQQIVRAHRAAVQPAQRPAPGAGPAADRQALLKSIFTDQPDQGAIQKQMDAVLQKEATTQEQRQQRLSEMVDTMLQINKVLTPAQRAEFQKMLDENTRARQIMGRRMMQRRQAPPQ